MQIGDTVLFGDPAHLFVVCTDILADGKAILFNLSTYKIGKDSACIIDVGEHPYVTVRSCVMYEFGEAWTPNTFRVNSMIAPTDHGPISLHLLRRIQAGAIKSSETKPKFKEIFQDMAVNLFVDCLRSMVA